MDLTADIYQLEHKQNLRPPSQVIKDIEFLRGLAIALTLIAHLSAVYPNSSTLKDFLSHHWLGSGVDLFFVISGFVITGSLRGRMQNIWSQSSSVENSLTKKRGVGEPTYFEVKRTLFSFWIRRAFRLLPGATVTIIVSMVFIYFFTPAVMNGHMANFHTHIIAGSAAFFQIYNFWIGPQISTGIPSTLFGAFWSLSLEEQFYLFYPLLLVFAGSWRRVGQISLIIIFGMFFVRKSLPSDFMWWFRFDGLFWGVAIAIYSPQISWINKQFSIGKAAASLGILIVCTLGLTQTLIELYQHDYANGVTLFFAAALVFVASLDKDFFNYPVIGPLFQFLGKRSYAIYLLHILIYCSAQLIRTSAMGSGLPMMAIEFLTIAFIGLSLVPVELFHRYIEMHFRDVGRKMSERILAVENK